MQLYNGNKNGEGIITIATEPCEDLTYKFDIDFKQPKNKPNCKVSLAEFCNTCSHIFRLKTGGILKCSSNEAKLIANTQMSDLRVDKLWRIMNSDDLTSGTTNNQEDCFTVTIQNDILKGLAKINNLNTNGIILFYCEVDGLVRLVTRIAGFGTMTLYIVDPGEPE